VPDAGCKICLGIGWVCDIPTVPGAKSWAANAERGCPADAFVLMALKSLTLAGFLKSHRSTELM